MHPHTHARSHTHVHTPISADQLRGHYSLEINQEGIKCKWSFQQVYVAGVCVCVCVSVCLPACLPACLSVSDFACTDIQLFRVIAYICAK